jgi:hypothetical protein
MNDPTPKRSLPRRDWIVLPLLSLLTVLVMATATEGLARLLWPEQWIDACLRAPDGQKPKSNCTDMAKAIEGPWFEARYNECGYRATGPCEPPPAATKRIAVLGTSTSFGFLVPFENVWFVRTAQDITARCGHPVDVQSLVQINRRPDHLDFGDFNVIARRMPEAISLKPQLVVLVVTPYDLAEMPDGGFNPAIDPEAVQPTVQPRRAGIIELAKSLKQVSRTVSVAEHFIYRDTNLYVWTYLHYGDRAAFLHPQMTPRWEARIAYLDDAVGYISAQLKPIGTPLVVAYAPSEVEGYLIADEIKIPDVDGESLARAVGAIAQRHGAIFADGASAFQGVRDVQDYFYRADGHLNGAGHGVFGSAVAKAVMSAKSIGDCDREAAR